MLNIRRPIIQDGFLVNHLSQINIRKLRQSRSTRFSGHQSTEQHSASTTIISYRIFSIYGTYKSFLVCEERVSTESDTVYLESDTVLRSTPSYWKNYLHIGIPDTLPWRFHCLYFFYFIASFFSYGGIDRTLTFYILGLVLIRWRATNFAARSVSNFELQKFLQANF